MRSWNTWSQQMFIKFEEIFRYYWLLQGWLSSLISVIFTWFLVSSYLLKLLVFLYFFWFDLISIYTYLFICALKEWEDFRTICTSTWESPWCLTPLFSSIYFICSPTIAVPLARFGLAHKSTWSQKALNTVALVGVWKVHGNWTFRAGDICTL